MNSEFMEWIADGMDQLVVPPNTYVHGLVICVRDEVDLDLLADGDFRDFDGVVEQGNAAIAVYHSGFA